MTKTWLVGGEGWRYSGHAPYVRRIPDLGTDETKTALRTPASILTYPWHTWLGAAFIPYLDTDEDKTALRTPASILTYPWHTWHGAASVYS